MTSFHGKRFYGLLGAWLGLASLSLLAQAPRDLGVVHQGSEVHAVVFGDFGYRGGSDSGQRAVASAIASRHAKDPFQIGLTLGDNFYERGVKSVDDPMWRDIWEADYGKSGIPYFASLGNHDYYGKEQAQVDYTQKSPSKTWRMPYRYYTYVAGPVRFYALDTDEGTTGFWHFGKSWSSEQASWLKESLQQKPDTKWRVVYGHHPVYSDGGHGDTKRMVKQLLPMLKAHRVDAYIAGHDHDLQYFIEDGIHFVIAGGGGKDLRPVTAKRAKFAKSAHGFLDLRADGRKLTLSLRDTSGAELFSRTLEK